jgi:hypothetical protein
MGTAQAAIHLARDDGRLPADGDPTVITNTRLIHTFSTPSPATQTQGVVTPTHAPAALLRQHGAGPNQLFVSLLSRTVPPRTVSILAANR